jgi:hypothetical protein
MTSLVSPRMQSFGGLAEAYVAHVLLSILACVAARNDGKIGLGFMGF